MKRILFSMIFLLLVGCSPKMNILIDGLPMPNTTYMSQSPATKMRAEAYVGRYYWEDSKTDDAYLYPEYLEIGKTYNLAKNTAYVGGKIRVVNPLRKQFLIQVIYTVKYKKDDFPYVISRILYHGKSHDKTFDIRRKTEPEKKPNTLVRVVINGEDSQNIFDINFIEYQLISEE